MMALAPVISMVTAVATLAIIPFGPQGAWGGELGLYGIDVPIGLLWFFAFGALAFYGLVLGGWASGSKYSFLGAMRSAAQLISYEVALGLSLLGVVDDRRLAVAHRHRRRPGAGGIWFIVPQFVGFCIFLVAGFAETNRARRSTCPRPTPSSSPATTPSSAACASARSSWPSTSTDRHLRHRGHDVPRRLARPGPDGSTRSGCC